ncbi:hypothetical protein WICPIJ_001904 [Wickerhamomyces pijperi]|uniref:Uncharacterized protein n=1 Tax=Wickerhamomyces pijperi TaxID=599730 RepID=A0A9P8TPF9_WICPI|nr:hypothetical protein WICPIJ_001904 [Wickerhamomyces pijperi]
MNLLSTIFSILCVTHLALAAPGSHNILSSSKTKPTDFPAVFYQEGPLKQDDKLSFITETVSNLTPEEEQLGIQQFQEYVKLNSDMFDENITSPEAQYWVDNTNNSAILKSEQQLKAEGFASPLGLFQPFESNFFTRYETLLSKIFTIAKGAKKDQTFTLMKPADLATFETNANINISSQNSHSIGSATSPVTTQDSATDLMWLFNTSKLRRGLYVKHNEGWFYNIEKLFKDQLISGKIESFDKLIQSKFRGMYSDKHRFTMPFFDERTSKYYKVSNSFKRILGGYLSWFGLTYAYEIERKISFASTMNYKFNWRYYPLGPNDGVIYMTMFIEYNMFFPCHVRCKVENLGLDPDY